MTLRFQRCIICQACIINIACFCLPNGTLVFSIRRLLLLGKKQFFRFYGKKGCRFTAKKIFFAMPTSKYRTFFGGVPMNLLELSKYFCGRHNWQHSRGHFQWYDSIFYIYEHLNTFSKYSSIIQYAYKYGASLHFNNK